MDPKKIESSFEYPNHFCIGFYGGLSKGYLVATLWKNFPGSWMPRF
jgi:hypothetical protein